MFIKNKYNISTPYNLTWDASYASAGQDHIGSHIVKDVCIHNPENINNLEGITEEAHYYYVVVITAVWACTC
jgi:hypothetical protein